MYNNGLPKCQAGDTGLIPGSGRASGEGNGKLLQYSCLENPMDGGAWQATVHGVAESDTTEWLSLPLSVVLSFSFQWIYILLDIASVSLNISPIISVVFLLYITKKKKIPYFPNYWFGFQSYAFSFLALLFTVLLLDSSFKIINLSCLEICSSSLKSALVLWI